MSIENQSQKVNNLTPRFACPSPDQGRVAASRVRWVFFVFLLFLLPNFAHAGIITSVSSSLGLTSGLVGHWTFDNKDIYGTTAIDKSGNGNSGTISGATKTIGKLDQALKFDGTNVVTTSTNGASANQGSVAFWFNPIRYSAGDSGYLFDHWTCGTGNRLYINTTESSGIRRISLILGSSISSTVVSDNNLLTGKWYHAVVSWDGSVAVTYINGVKQTTEVSYSGLTELCNNFRIGNTEDSIIDDVRIYNRALSAGEIKRIYNIGAGIKLKTSTDSLTSGLVGHWTFDGTDISGTIALDKSGNGNSGTITGATKTIGKLGQALKFGDTSDTRVNISNGFDTPASFTIALWINPKDTISDRYVTVDGNRKAILLGQQNNYFNIYNYPTGTASDTQIPATKNVWQHIVYTANGTNIKGYKDGQEIFSETGSLGSGATSYIIGSASVPPDAVIDDVRIYNRALTAEEVKRLYNIGEAEKIKTPTDTLTDGLVGHWTFDQKDVYGTTALDKSGNGNNGTISGATKTAGKLGQGLSFDGVDDYINCGIGSSLQITGSFTLSAWIKPNNVTNWQTIVETANDTAHRYGMWIYSGNLYAVTDNVYVSSYKSGISIGKWQQVLVVFDSVTDKKTYYINGQNLGQTTSETDDPSPASATCQIAHSNAYTAGTHNFKGLIDDVRIYNRALSAEEVKRLYEMGR